MGIPMLYGIIGLAAFAGIYSIYGGLKAVALTDVVQVVFLVGGGLVTTYIALDLLGEGGGVYQGMVNLYGEASDKFHLILDKSHPGYKDLPGISVILGGLWVANLYYWGATSISSNARWPPNRSGRRRTGCFSPVSSSCSSRFWS